MTVLVIDDELLARKRIISLLSRVEDVEIIGECQNGQDAITSINNLNPDLVFLDIEMKDMNGFDVMKNIDSEQSPLVIFVTAYDEFAIKAFDIFAIDYLLKPFENSRFYNSVNKAISFYKSQEHSNIGYKINEMIDYVSKVSHDHGNDLFSKKFPVRTGNKVNFIDQSSIKYVLASGSYPEIITEDKKIVVRDSLNNLLTSLNKDLFMRIHRSVIINIEFILEIIHSNHTDFDIKMKDGKLFRVGRSYRKTVKTRLRLK
ncbi:LytTR family DNA-binding domain-containing protein [uncultured Psychroserpens sp.]|uniref:LytR/AlgR family response regulator transcription factor n=1 Tax=uncultured Psychroserpens sp. TaxID=255436 RepID=UPI002610BA7B|nr:LytTR family DNA-binding domain-containing protein [uncultured Psychroserpens sp.]